MAPKKEKSMIRVAVVGGSGYTGGELLRILLGHPAVRIIAVTSRTHAGQPVDTVFPSLGVGGLPPFQDPDPDALAKAAQFAFLALPHGEAMDVAAALLAQGVKVVDLSADFRLRNPRVYARWYGGGHRHGKLLKKAVYGLPEFYRRTVRRATLVANPGCYPTAVILALAPLLKGGWVRPASLVVDATSGVSGAGRTPALLHHFPEVHDGLSAYKVGCHRHTPEMAQELSCLAGRSVWPVFTPHLAPMNRGLLVTGYADLTRNASEAEIYRLYRNRYRREPFVKVLEPGRQPNTAHVRGSNFCHVGIVRVPGSRKVVVTAAIDNLGKGAAGQAVQNMNLMMGLEETAGLLGPGVFP